MSYHYTHNTQCINTCRECEKECNNWFLKSETMAHIFFPTCTSLHTSVPAAKQRVEALMEGSQSVLTARIV